MDTDTPSESENDSLNHGFRRIRSISRSYFFPPDKEAGTPETIPTEVPLADDSEGTVEVQFSDEFDSCGGLEKLDQDEEEINQEIDHFTERRASRQVHTATRHSSCVGVCVQIRV